MSFPLCQLHNTRIVDAFPNSCPLGCTNTHAKLMEIKDCSLWQGGSDPHCATAVALLSDTCSRCVGRLLRDAHIQFLRRQGTQA